MRKRHRIIGVGGTFDHFHAGHEKLILFAAELADEILIGVTDDHMTQHKKYAEQIQSYADRVRAVTQFCRQHHLTGIVTQLHDAIGPTLENSIVQALAVTPETVSGGSKINELRSKLGLRELPIYICDFFIAENGQALHAEQIRSGRMGRKGQAYTQVFAHNTTLLEPQRQFFQLPQGEVVTKPVSNLRSPWVAVVGDYSLEQFIQHKWQYNLGVFDLKQQRQSVQSPILTQLVVDEETTNPAGTLSSNLVKSLELSLHASKFHLKVVGEEDLAAVALVILAPLGSLIYYGQPDLGMVCMQVTEELKEKFFDVLSENSRSD